MKNGENLFEEIPKIKGAHTVGGLFFIALETDYGFDYYKTREMTRALVEKRYELGRTLDEYDIKSVAEEVGGKSLDRLYEILAPGIEWNAYYYSN